MEFSYDITKDILSLSCILTVFMLTRKALVSASYTHAYKNKNRVQIYVTWIFFFTFKYEYFITT